MAEIKISQLPDQSSASSDDVLSIVDSPGGTPTTKKITFANLVSSITALVGVVVATLYVSGVFTLAQQPAGRVPYTESGGVVTTTPGFTYTSTSQTLAVPNIVASTTAVLAASFTAGTSSQWLGFATASGTAVNALQGTFATATVAGSGLCLSSGAGCSISGESDTLATVSNRGASATATLQLLGGFLAASSTVTSTFTAVGQGIFLGGITSTNATSQNIFASRSLVINENMATSGIGWLSVGTSTISPNFAVSLSTTTAYGQLRLINPSNSGIAESGLAFQTGESGFGISDGSRIGEFGSNLYIKSLESAGHIIFNTAGTDRWRFLESGILTPNSNNTYDLGKTDSAIKDIHASGTANLATVTSTSIFATSAVFATTTIAGVGVCLSNGAGCPPSGGGGSDVSWTWNEAGGFVRQTTSTDDLILGSTATTTGAPVYLDNSGNLLGTSTLTIGHSTNVNVVIGGTSSTQTAAGSSLFVMSGDDLWVKGNIGSATTVYAAGGFMTGGAKHDGVGTRGVVGNMELSFSGALLVENVNDLTRIIIVDPLAGAIYTSGLTNTSIGLVNSPFGKIYTSSTWTTSGNIVPGANNEMQIGSATRSIATVHASGTSQLAYVSSTAVSVGGQAVCLEDGTDCPAVAASLSGGIADSVAVWGSASTLGATSTFAYSTTTGVLTVQGGYISSTVIQGMVRGSGSCTTPSFTFSGDTDTGFVRNGADSVGICSGGGQYFTVDGTANTSFLSLLPGSNSVYDLGSQSKAYRSLYVSSTAFFGGPLIPRISAFPELGSATSAWGNFYSSSSLYLGGHIFPTLNGVMNLGSVTGSLNNVYVSGTANLAKIAAGQTTSTILSWGFASGTTLNVWKINSSGTIDLAPTSNVTVNGSNRKVTVPLLPVSCWPSSTNGAGTPTQNEMSTNKNNYFFGLFSNVTGTQSYLECDIPMPDSYDGGTLNLRFAWTSTSTNTGSVTWVAQAVSLGSGDNLDAAFSATTSLSQAHNGTSLTLNYTTNTAAITPAGTPAGNEIMHLRLGREPNNPSDQHTAWAVLNAMWLEYGVNLVTD